jgi:heat shock protein HslJ
MKKIVFSLAIMAGLVVLAACASSASQQSGGDLTGQVWVLTELLGKAPVADTGISALFNTDGSLSGSAGCNQYNGKYTTSGSSITISNLANTMMACPQAVMDQETAYLKALGDAKTYSVKGDTLTLAGADGKTLASYKAQSQDLAGSNWEVIGYNNGKQAVTGVLLNTTITASFGKDGNLTGNAGCNTYNGPYKVDGSKITIGPLASTMMFCNDPEGVMDQEAQYLAALQTASTYQIEGERLELRTADGALAVDFTRK